MTKSGLADSPFFRVRTDGQAPPVDTPPSTTQESKALGAPSQHLDSAPVHLPEKVIVHRRTSAPKSATRLKVKQGFQVYKDQVITLSELQFETYKHTGKKPQIGEFIRAALDDFIARKKRELESNS
jgi:hypothetical protein